MRLPEVLVFLFTYFAYSGIRFAHLKFEPLNKMSKCLFPLESTGVKTGALWDSPIPRCHQVTLLMNINKPSPGVLCCDVCMPGVCVCLSHYTHSAGRGLLSCGS